MSKCSICHLHHLDTCIPRTSNLQKQAFLGRYDLYVFKKRVHSLFKFGYTLVVLELQVCHLCYKNTYRYYTVLDILNLCAKQDFMTNKMHRGIIEARFARHRRRDNGIPSWLHYTVTSQHKIFYTLRDCDVNSLLS